MGKRTGWVVSVTRLKEPFVVYANVPTEDSANKLATAATDRGYKDVAVYKERDYWAAKRTNVVERRQQQRKRRRKDAKPKQEIHSPSQ